MRILIALLSLFFTLTFDMNAIGKGAEFYETLSVPLIVVIFVMPFILMLIIPAVVYLTFMYIFKDRKE